MTDVTQTTTNLTAAADTPATLRPRETSAPALLAVPAPSRFALPLALSLLFASVLPDAMVAPVLRGLIAMRYDVSLAAAHWFMAVNLIGAALAVPMIAVLRKRVAPAAMLALAAAANAILLAVMARPIGFGPTLAVRVLEGAADLMVIAVLFDLIGKCGSPGTHGRRFGLAATTLMFAVAAGLALGGQVGHAQPVMALWVGAIACLLVALAAGLLYAPLNMMVRWCPAIQLPAHQPRTRPLIGALAMTFSDRAIAGLLTTTVPLYLAAAAGMSSRSIGLLLAAAMATMAVGAAPAGRLADRLGHGRVRFVSALLYAAAFAAVLLHDGSDFKSSLLLMIGLGVAGAALLPTSLALATRSGRGAVAMGAFHAAGSVGFFTGIASAAVLIHALEPSLGEVPAAQAVILSFAFAHALVTICIAALPYAGTGKRQEA
jgi:predicted MFS family arabinose efflux permease